MKKILVTLNDGTSFDIVDEDYLIDQVFIKITNMKPEETIITNMTWVLKKDIKTFEIQAVL